MSSSFQIIEHVIDTQHIREYARATANSQEDVLRMVIKQYIPLSNRSPQPGDITIIGAHANGFPKELYEPLWEDLLRQSDKHGFRIRSIWIADVAWQGTSSNLNAKFLGNDPSWHDHARDLLHMINHFRLEMPLPLVGIGHSFGAAVLCNLALIHPRLLSTLVLLDPVIQNHAYSEDGPNPAGKSAFRKEIWTSRKEAEASFKNNKFYQSWDVRVLDKWCKYGLIDTPSEQHSNSGVTLTTNKHQECFTFLRQGWQAYSEDGKELLYPHELPDLEPGGLDTNGFYRPEAPKILSHLHELRPSALYIFGSKSPMSQPESRKIKMEVTGTGIGGSGGVKHGRVKDVVLNDIGHLVAMEATQACAEAAALWLEQETKRFEKEKKEYTEWTKKSLLDKQTLSEEWKRRARGSRGSKM